MDFIIAAATTLLCVAVVGYLLAVLKEQLDLKNHRVVIKSKNITQLDLDNIDMKMFKMGHLTLYIGDEIRVRLKGKRSLRGTLLGAKKRTNALCLITSKDEVVEVNIKTIEHLRIVTKYGRFF